MREELKYIGNIIIENKEQLVKNLLQLHDKDYCKKIQEAEIELSQVENWRTELIHYLGEALYKDREMMAEKIKAWAQNVGETALQKGIPLDQSIRALTSYRTVIWEVFTDELNQRRFEPITMLDVSKIIDPLLDEISFIFSTIYLNHHNRLMKLAHSAMEELSAPVVPLCKEIGVLPLIGEIDTHRANLIMEIALEKSAQLKLKHLIIDVSGVPMIDTMVAYNIFKVVKVLKLIGVKATLTGIRPEIAQTLVSLGVEFEDVKTKMTVAQALDELGVVK
ncbi:STAS domain-containing protein [Bacillus taeanensis]|uniref:STAS domain-containing protein n=1 Tax=Bacillus taeanensis TaxID=273032 RepID=A0A366XVE4_9BACI|nr:STAS domain-containing protein [Bacillus taeanensis]RBW68729.1 STAS domain-containing protein [Bacillus taeanensis]